MSRGKSAYEVRRYLTLVQVLATPNSPDRERALIHLCYVWEVPPIWADDAKVYLDETATVPLLARHVVKYHQEGSRDG